MFILVYQGYNQEVVSFLPSFSYILVSIHIQAFPYKVNHSFQGFQLQTCNPLLPMHIFPIYPYPCQHAVRISSR